MIRTYRASAGNISQTTIAFLSKHLDQKLIGEDVKLSIEFGSMDRSGSSLFFLFLDTNEFGLSDIPVITATYGPEISHVSHWVEILNYNRRIIFPSERIVEISEVIEIEMSYKRLIPNDDEPSSYINFYIANNGIVMPSFDDDKADKNAQNIIQSVFPKRKVIVINGIDISLGGGNIHCITQQQPLSI